MSGTRCTPGHRPRSRRLVALTAALGLAAIAMAGCIRYEQTIVVRPDGSGTVEYLVAFSEDLLEGMIPDADEPEPGDFHPLATAERYQQDGFAGYTITIPFSSLAEFHDIAGLAGENIVIEQGEGGEWSFAMTFSPDENAAGASGLLGEESLTQGEMAALQAALEEGFASAGASWVIQIALPGEPLEHNATRNEGGLLIWEPDGMLH